MILTRAQHLAYGKLASEHTGAMVDEQGTRDMWAKAPLTHGMIQVIEHRPDATVLLWVIDQDGDIVVEAGAEPGA